MKKIISQKTEPKDTSVIWLDTNTQQLKSFNNGKWIALGVDNDSITKLVGSGDLKTITAKKSEEYGSYYEIITPNEDGWLYLPGSPNLWNVNGIKPNTVLGNYCLVPVSKNTQYGITYSEFDNLPDIYIGSTLGETTILNNITNNVIATFDFDIGQSSNFSTNVNIVKVGDTMLFTDCTVKVIAVYGKQYDQKILCDPVTVWSARANKFVTYTVTGNTYTDGLLPALSLTVSSGDNSSTSVLDVTFSLKDSSATISKYYQDCYFYVCSSDTPNVSKETNLLEGYRLLDINRNIITKYLFTSYEKDNPPMQESSSILSTQALSVTYAYRAGDYLLTYNESKSTWQIRKDSSSTALASSWVMPTINVDFNSTDNITARKEISVTSNCLGGFTQAVMANVPTNTNIVGYRVAFADNVMGIVTSASKIPIEQSSTDILTTKNNGIAVNAIDQPTYMYYITCGGKYFIIGANVIDDIWSVEANVSN